MRAADVSSQQRTSWPILRCSMLCFLMVVFNMRVIESCQFGLLDPVLDLFFKKQSDSTGYVLETVHETV
jgi:hypothetical protein